MIRDAVSLAEVFLRSRLAILVCVLLAGAVPARAQEPLPPLWAPCQASAGHSVKLGSDQREWEPFPPDGKLTLASRATNPPPKGIDAFYCLRVLPSAFPSTGATHAAILSAAGADSATLVSLAVFDEPTQADGAVELSSASDAPAPYNHLLLSGKGTAPRQVYILVTREDGGSNPAAVQIGVTDERLGDEHSLEADAKEDPGWFVKSLAGGHAFRYGLDEQSYQELLTFGNCDWLASVERNEKGCVDAQLRAGGSGQLGSRIYPLVSALVGRSREREFREGTPRASLSEPMVVFFGLGGLNRILLLDCRTTEGRNDKRRCNLYSEPWITTFQRARYFWAVYIEDEQVPFDTSIDVEFKSRAPSVDYESYDPRNLARARGPVGAGSAARRFVRIGYQRFRVREAPLAIQVAFTRQGANYGLRQWVRVYREFSERPWVVSGALFVPGTSVELQAVHVTPLLPADGSRATQARITREPDHRQAFASVVFRWPSVRGRAENEPTPLRRLLVNATPDVAAGLGLPFGERKVFIAGASWPFLWDRLSFTLGWKISQEEEFAAGYLEGDVVPIGTSPAAVSVRRWHSDPKPALVGLSIELIRSR